MTNTPEQFKQLQQTVADQKKTIDRLVARQLKLERDLAKLKSSVISDRSVLHYLQNMIRSITTRS